MVIQQFFQVQVWFRSRLLKEICGVLDRKARQSGLGGGGSALGGVDSRETEPLGQQ